MQVAVSVPHASHPSPAPLRAAMMWDADWLLMSCFVPNPVGTITLCWRGVAFLADIWRIQRLQNIRVSWQAIVLATWPSDYLRKTCISEAVLTLEVWVSIFDMFLLISFDFSKVFQVRLNAKKKKNKKNLLFGVTATLPSVVSSTTPNWVCSKS